MAASLRVQEARKASSSPFLKLKHAPARERKEAEYVLARRNAINAARTDFLAFCMFVKPDWNPNWHHKIICRVLQRWAKGEIKYLIITAPPRHGKSEIMSRLLPAWMFGCLPHTRVMTASYAATLASDFNRDVQRIMMSPEYKEVFPRIHLNERNRRTVADGSWLRNNETFEVVGTDMYYKCAGIEGGFTGKGGNKLLLDDFLKDWADAHSRLTLESQWDWFRSVFLTRASNDAGVAATVTRWSHDDLIGRFLALKKQLGTLDEVVVLDYPAIQDREPTWWDPREIGEALWPTMFSLRFLMERRDMSGERIFEALYQQRPTVSDGEIIKREWWRFYTAAELPKKFDFKCISIDLTFDDEGRNNDFVVMQVWGKKGTRLYLINQVRERMSFVRSKAILRILCRDHKPNAVYVEKAANGAALISDLRGVIPGLVAVKPGSNSKAIRMEAAAPEIEAGNVYLPKEAPWLGPYIEEFAEFPAGRNDDQVDTTSQAINKLKRRFSSARAIPVSVRKRSTWDDAIVS